MAGRSLGVGKGPARDMTSASALHLDDIQHILLTRTPAITGRYEFLTFDTPAGGRAWLSEPLDKVQSASGCRAR